MTDARFLRNNFVTCEANQVKFEMLVWKCKKLVKILELGQELRPCEATLYQKVGIFDILGA